MATIPVHVFATWKVKDGNLQAVLQLLKEVSAKTLEEEGNLFYKIHQSHAEANTLILLEGYTDAAAQKAHMNTDHFKKIVVGQIVPLLEAREVTLTTPIEV